MKARMRWSDRTEFIGGHVRPEVKKRLYAMALEQRKPFARLLAEILDFYLSQSGRKG